jgi:hypothetical protein
MINIKKRKGIIAMYHQYKITHEFNKSKALQTTDIEMQTLPLIANCIDELKDKGFLEQVSGGLKFNHEENSFYILCTERFAGSIETKSSIKNVLKLEK